MKLLFAILLLLHSTASLLHAQTSPKPIFSKLTKKDGLASNIVLQVVQDKKGFLWIATQSGLHRYDGNHLLTFHNTPGDSTSLADNLVGLLLLDKKNRLWTVSGKRLGIFDTDRFVYRETIIKYPVTFIKRITQDEKGSVVIFTDHPQPLVYNESTRQFEEYVLPALPEGYKIDNFFADSVAGMLWISTRQGLLSLNKKTNQYSLPSGNPSGNIIVDSLAAVQNTRHPFVSSDGNFWMVSWVPFSGAPVIYKFDKQTNNVSKFELIKKTYHEVWNFKQQRNGRLWVYGAQLLAYYDPAVNRFININSEAFIENDIQYSFVNNVFEDRENNVWVSTDKGLFRFNLASQVFRNLPNFRPQDTAASFNAVTSVIETNSKAIWVSTLGNGVYSYDQNWKPVSNPLINSTAPRTSLPVLHMLKRRNGDIWVALQSGEIRIVSATDGAIASFVSSKLIGKMGRQLLEDKRGNIWIGTYTGELWKLKNANWQDSNSTEKMSIQFSTIMKLYEDISGNLWVCTSSGGLYKIDPVTNKVLHHYEESKGKNDGLTKDGATDIYQYNDSTYLIGSNSLCILNSRTNTFRYLSVADGLPPENINTLVIDKQKRIWVTTSSGLYRLNLEKKIPISFGTAHGIINNNFENSSAVLSDGRVVIGTSRDFLVFNPSTTIDSAAAPAVVISDIRNSGVSLALDSVLQNGELVLPHDNSSLSIDLSTLSFQKQYKLLYMLEELDNEWRTTDQWQVNYPYLPPGNYTFKVKAATSEGVESATVTSLKVIVRTPFWKSWWFWGMLVAALLGFLYWMDRKKIKRREFIQQMRSNIAGNLHQEVNTVLSKINILSEVARIKADNDIEKSKEYIDQIHDKSQHMIVAMNDMLWSIDPSNDNMQRTIDRIREYIDGLNNRNDSRIELMVQEEVKTVNLDMDARYQLLYIFKEFVELLPKYSGTHYKIDLALENQQLLLSIIFDNENTDPEALEAFVNTRDIQNRVGNIGGEVTLDTNKNNSLFRLKTPLQRSR